MKEKHWVGCRESFRRFSCAAAERLGCHWAFGTALGLILLWGLTGPLFHFSDTWQLIINTATTIVTFLMVFLIQNTQNRDGAAIQTKLDELIRAGAAQNTFIGIEHLTEEELDKIRRRIETYATQAADTVLEVVQEKAARAADRASGLE